MNLHIVALNIPYPPDYGGMIDSYYRIKALKDLGVRIHLHCFEYGRHHSKELESLCETTFYYQRKSGLLSHITKSPYIVSSRQSDTLLKNLISNEYPILFDGLHTTYYFKHAALLNRKKLVRLHNVEHEYYNTLAENEASFLRKVYFRIESAKLRVYEKVLVKADYILAISENDHAYFNHKYHNSVKIGPFHPFYDSESIIGKGDYIIYHGDLSVNENAIICDLLISNVLSKLTHKCIIAGKDPQEKIKYNASRFPNIKVISNPDNAQMKGLIANAQINLLPALASNGFKLKLLIALYAGRHCIVNSVISESSLIKDLFHVADTDLELITKINFLMNVPFTDEMIQVRKKVFSENYDVRENALKLVDLIFNNRKH